MVGPSPSRVGLSIDLIDDNRFVSVDSGPLDSVSEIDRFRLGAKNVFGDNDGPRLVVGYELIGGNLFSEGTGDLLFIEWVCVCDPDA